MSGFTYRDAKAFYCECGLRYLWEQRGGWDAYNGESTPEETIRDYYLTTSGPVTECVSCGRSLVVLACTGEGRG